jgi:hypothetical protein
MGFVTVDQLVGRRIDAAHAGDKHEIADAHAEAPRASRLDGAGRREKRDVIGRHECTSCNRS